MAKIILNNKEFEIDSSALATATAALKSHFSTNMNGTGATVVLDGVSYSIDSAKLAVAENAFGAYLDTISGDLPEEERLEGDGQEFYTTAPSTLTFRSTAPLDELQDVQINGETVDPSNYTLEEGSTIVKLNYDYLGTLDVGKYELSVVSDSKTAKGDFTVAAPELNEYGFYYNQPYLVTEELFFEEVLEPLLIFLPNHTVSVFNLVTGDHKIVDYTYSNNQICFTYGLFMSSVSFELTVVANNTLSGNVQDSFLTREARFELSDRVVSDSCYIYVRDEALYRWNQNIVDEYPPVKDNVFGEKITNVGVGAYSNCPNITHVVLPDTIQTIYEGAFLNCQQLKSITLPEGLAYILDIAFLDCTSLDTIIFKGTVSQWNAIEKFNTWNTNVPATHVHCIDGDVAL